MTSMNGVSIVLLALLFVRAGSAEDPDRRKKLEEIDRKIAQIRGSLDQNTQQEKSELAQLEQVEKVEQLISEQTRLLDAAVTEQTSKVQDAEKRMRTVQADFESKKAALRERLVALYKMGQMSYARLLLSVEDASSMAGAYAYISQMVESDREKVRAYQDALVRLTQERDGYGKKVTELKSLEQANAAKRAELDAERLQKQTAILQIRREKTRHLQALSELEASAQQLRKLLNEIPSTAPSLHLTSMKGALKWPHAGKVTLGFGLHRDPQYSTITVQNGIDIDAPYNDPVISVFTGKVVYADWFRGYGHIVIIDHGDKFFSLYAHLSRFAVSVGDTVAPGGVIGYVGDTGSLKGAYLYFELRQGEKPLNPLDWLEKKKHAG